MDKEKLIKEIDNAVSGVVEDILRYDFGKDAEWRFHDECDGYTRITNAIRKKVEENIK